MKKISILIISLLFTIISCKKDVVEPDLALKSITLSNNNLELLLGSSSILTTTTLPASSTAALFWSSSDSTIVKVNNAGKVEGLKIGEATITVKNYDGKISSSCKVFVKPISVNQIILNRTSLTMVIGSKDKLSVVFDPINTTNQKVLWSTSNPLIVKIDQDGNLEASGTGDVIIRAITDDGKASAECKISVILPSLTGLDIDKKDVQVPFGEDVQFKAIVTPPNAQPEEMIWSSSDNSVASISASGLAKALKPGKTTIKVTNKANTISAVTELTVLAIKVQAIQLNSTQISLSKGSVSKLNFTILPANATDKAVKYNSSNAAVASIDAIGNISALTDGETTITVASNDGGASSRLIVKVTPIKVSGITLNKTALNLVVNGQETITTNILPLTADNKSVTWKSSNPAVASVDNAGKILAFSIGSAVITATSADGGGVTANCSVEVSTIDKFIKIAAKPNVLVSSSMGNSSKLSVGILNSSSAPISIKFIRIYVNGILSKSYSVNDPDLITASYLYDLGPFALSSGLVDVNTLMLGWTVQFEYEYKGTIYNAVTAVKRNVIGQVNNNDFSSIPGQVIIPFMKMTKKISSLLP